MRQALLFSSLAAITLGVAGCPTDPVVPADSGPPSGDVGRIDVGPCDDDSDCLGRYCNFGSNRCCERADPPYEICGDMIDQNCDGEDGSCGDEDGDMIAACVPGEDPLGGECDCDDTRATVRPAYGTVPPAAEICDGFDNDCNGRIDEASECCEACAVLGASRERADVCTTDGICDCSTDSASGPCPVGTTCCSIGCVDTNTNFAHCGFCEASCTAGTDTCSGGTCNCGGGPPCEFTGICVGGVCMDM